MVDLLIPIEHDNLAMNITKARDKLSIFLGFRSQDKSAGSEGNSVSEKTDEKAIILDGSMDLPQSTRIESDSQAWAASDVDSISSTEKTSNIGHRVEVEVQSMEENEYPSTIKYTQEQLAQVETKLADFMRMCVGAYGALISTVDGHEIAASLKRDIPAHKISTMNSALLALGESIAKESSQRLCQFVILENSDGRVVSLRINDILMLTCISTKETNLGMLLSSGRHTADILANILQ